MADVEMASEPVPGPSKVATVADESEEIAAEAGTSTSIKQENGDDSAAPAATATTTNGEASDELKAENAGGADGAEGEEEEKEDPNRIPDDACETLYIQNLNEKVRIPGASELLLLDDTRNPSRNEGGGNQS